MAGVEEPCFANPGREQLQNACKAEGMSTIRAAEEFQVQRSTVQDHVSGRVIPGSRSERKYLDNEDEKKLVDFCLDLQQK